MQICRYTCMYSYAYPYTYTCAYTPCALVCVCVCVCVCVHICASHERIRLQFDYDLSKTLGITNSLRPHTLVA